MNIQTQKNVQRILAPATALVIIGGGLNILAFETLGFFDAASVILALYVGSWAFVLGNIGVILSAAWFFINRKAIVAEPAGAQPRASVHEPIELPALRYHRMCCA